MNIVRITMQVFFWGGGEDWHLVCNSTARHSGILINSFGEELAQFSLFSMYLAFFQKNSPQHKRGFTVLVFLYTSVKTAGGF